MKKCQLLFIFSVIFIFCHFDSQAQKFKKKKPETLYARNKKKNISPIYVGIGTSTPTAQLHTVGNLRFEGLNSGSSASNVLITDAQGNVFTRDLTSLLGSPWMLNGNTVSATNFLGSINNEAVRIRTNNQQRLIVSATGQVGINVLTPSALFHTNGTVRFEGITADNSSSRLAVMDNNGNLFYKDAASLQSQFWSLTGNAGTSPATNFIGTTDNSKLVVKTNNIERMTILADGKVGVGTSTPNSLFEVTNTIPDNHIKASGNGPSVILENPVLGQNVAGRFGFATLANQFVTGSAPGDVILQNLGATQSLIFGTTGGGSGNGVERMRISASGFVGIGNSAPTAVLHTTGTVRHQGLANGSGNPVVIDANGNLFVGTSSAGTNDWSLTGNTATNPTTNFLGTTDNVRLVFRTANVEKMTILADGKVGIGTSTPSAALQVFGSTPDNHIRISGTAPSLVLENGSVNSAGRIGFATVNNNFVTGTIPGDMVVQTLGATNSLIFGTAGGGTGNGFERARINPIGYVGIATQTPTAKLHVDCSAITGQTNPSNIRFQNLGSGTGSALVIDANGYVYKSNTLTGKSNQELSDEISSLKNEIEQLKKMILDVKKDCSMFVDSFTGKKN